MRIGMIGLGRMGGNIARRLQRSGHQPVVFDRNPEAVAELELEGFEPADSLEEIKKKLGTEAVFWVMLPAGEPTEKTIQILRTIAEPGDVVIDGGNSFYKDDIRRAKLLADKGIHYIDVGTSGGVWGLERGYCMMIGGPKEAVDHLDPIFDALAPGIGTIPRTPNRMEHEGEDARAEKGYIHAGPAGAGHFVKMVHNGIEYGLMQAYAEGFDILKSKQSSKLPEDERYVLNLTDIAEIFPGMRSCIRADMVISPAECRTAGIAALDRCSIIDALVTEQCAKGIVHVGHSDEPVPIVVADLVSEMA